MFLESSDEALVRRFESVRRPHPLQGDGRIVDGIAAERELLRELRGDADLVIDTSSLNVHELRAKMDAQFAGEEEPELRATVGNANQLLGSVDGELKGTLEEARRALASADRVLQNTDATLVGAGAPAQQELRAALQEVVRAARAVRVLADYLERHPESLVRGKNGSP